MKRSVGILVVLALAACFQLPAFGQKSTTAESQDEQRVRLGTTEVALDVVVRDKKGRPVRDLKESDFEIYEDGVRQRIESFRLVVHEPEKAPAEIKSGVKREEPATRQPSSRDPFAEASFIAMVFDRLSPDARNLAHKAALNYAGESVKPDDLVGVFAIDLSLRTLQVYTSNAELVRQAIDRAASLNTSPYASSAEQVRMLSDRQSALQNATDASEATAAAGGRVTGDAANAAGATTGVGMAEQALNQMMMTMSEAFEVLERDQQGYATTNGLMTIGAYFDGHPWHQDVTVKVEDQHHPATRHLGKSFQIKDEIYQMKNFSRDRVHVVMSLDASSVDLTLPAVHRADRDFALAWWRDYGRGRVFYTALGHRPEVWQDERFQQHLLGALRWAMRLV